MVVGIVKAPQNVFQTELEDFKITDAIQSKQVHESYLLQKFKFHTCINGSELAVTHQEMDLGNQFG